MCAARKHLGSISRDRVDAPREPSWPRQRGLTRERDSRQRVRACGVRRPRERHVAATRLTVLAEQSFPAGLRKLHAGTRTLREPTLGRQN
jgi:hypothetical protein